MHHHYFSSMSHTVDSGHSPLAWKDTWILVTPKDPPHTVLVGGSADISEQKDLVSFAPGN